jgi:hypothetical protein
MNPLPPWANGPFELLVHAEGHLQTGQDFDRRISLISFDDAIEVAISTYLALHPIQRGNREYKRADVEKWLNNYHSKLDFLSEELATRNLGWKVERGHIVWAHDDRNEQYHGGHKGTPERNCLAIVREAALWIFSVLFDDADVEKRLGAAVAEGMPPASPQRNSCYDRAIDREYDMVQIGSQSFYASEIFFSVDYEVYCEIGSRLCQDPPKEQAEEAGA